MRYEDEANAALAAKIAAMESKLLVGGKTISAHTADQERKLRQKHKEILEQEEKER